MAKYLWGLGAGNSVSHLFHTIEDSGVFFFFQIFLHLGALYHSGLILLHSFF